VASVSRVSVAFANYRKPDGQHETVVLIGADPTVGSRFPLPYVPGSQGALDRKAIVVDETNADTLGIHTFPTHIEVNDRRAHVSGKVHGFASFLGSPYIFTSYEDAARYSKLGPEEAVYLILRVNNYDDISSIKNQLKARLRKSTCGPKMNLAAGQNYIGLAKPVLAPPQSSQQRFSRS